MGICPQPTHCLSTLAKKTKEMVSVILQNNISFTSHPGFILGDWNAIVSKGNHSVFELLVFKVFIFAVLLYVFEKGIQLNLKVETAFQYF